jgi:hypothetical protein
LLEERHQIFCSNISKTPSNRADTRCHCEPDALGAVALRIDIYAGHQRADFSLGLGGLQFQPGSALLINTGYNVLFLRRKVARGSGTAFIWEAMSAGILLPRVLYLCDSAGDAMDRSKTGIPVVEKGIQRRPFLNDV